jgi:hypothetical protein
MGAAYFKNALSATRETLDIDWEALERAWEIMPVKEDNDEEVRRGIEWINSNYARRIQRAGGVAARTETVLQPRQEDIDIARLQHSRLSDEQE